MSNTKMDSLRTGDIAKQGGVNLETIRYYGRRGLLPRPPRTAAGYRSFDADAVRRLRFIKHAQALGFSLKVLGTPAEAQMGGMSCPGMMCGMGVGMVLVWIIGLLLLVLLVVVIVKLLRR